MLDEFRSTNITWDKATSRIYSPVTANASDENGRKLVVQIVNGGQVEDLTGATLHLYWQTRDKAHIGLDVFKAVDLKNGEFELSYTTGMLSNKGVINANLVLVDTVGRVVSERFKITVTEGIDDDAIQSENSFTTLTQALIDIGNLGQDYTPILNDITAQLQQTEQELSSQLAQSNKGTLTQNIVDSTSINVATKSERKPLITFIDDDGVVEVYTRLKPIFESRGVPLTLAIVSDWVGKKGVVGSGKDAMTKEQILELQDLGWEIASHEKSHIAMGGVTDEQIIYDEIVQSKYELLEMGFDVKNLVYPYGQSNSKMIKEAQKVYKVGASTQMASNDSVNKMPLNNFGLSRVALGSYTESDTLLHHKSVIDKAISENSWLIFMTHVWAQDENKDQLIADVIDYALSKNVDIVNLDEGLDVFGDKINIEGLARVLPDNTIQSDVLVPNIKTPINAVTAETPATHFQDGVITHTQIGGAGASSFPEGLGGVLITDTTFKDPTYQRQTYKIAGHGRTYERTTQNNGLWSDFEKIQHSVNFNVTHTFGDVPAQSSISFKVDVQGVNNRSPVVVATTYPLPEGIILSARVSTPSEVTLTVTNVKPNSVTLYENIFNGTVLIKQ